MLHGERCVQVHKNSILVLHQVTNIICSPSLSSVNVSSFFYYYCSLAHVSETEHVANYHLKMAAELEAQIENVVKQFR